MSIFHSCNLHSSQCNWLSPIPYRTTAPISGTAAAANIPQIDHEAIIISALEAVPPPVPPPTFAVVAVAARVLVPDAVLLAVLAAAEALAAALIALAEALSLVAASGGSGATHVLDNDLNESEASVEAVARMLVRVLLVAREEVTVENWIVKS